MRSSSRLAWGQPMTTKSTCPSSKFIVACWRSLAVKVAPFLPPAGGSNVPSSPLSNGGDGMTSACCKCSRPAVAAVAFFAGEGHEGRQPVRTAWARTACPSRAELAVDPIAQDHQSASGSSHSRGEREGWGCGSRCKPQRGAIRQCSCESGEPDSRLVMRSPGVGETDGVDSARCDAASPQCRRRACRQGGVMPKCSGVNDFTVVCENQATDVHFFHFLRSQPAEFSVVGMATSPSPSADKSWKAPQAVPSGDD